MQHPNHLRHSDKRYLLLYVCHILTFVAFDVCHLKTFVANDVCRQLWRLSLKGLSQYQTFYSTRTKSSANDPMHLLENRTVDIFPQIYLTNFFDHFRHIEICTRLMISHRQRNPPKEMSNSVHLYLGHSHTCHPRSLMHETWNVIKSWDTRAYF